MKIERTSYDYNYLAALYQTQLTQNAKTTTEQSTDSTTSADKLLLEMDSVEISDDVYASYAAYASYASARSTPSVSQSFPDPLEGLVSDGTITSDQKEAIVSAMESSSMDVSEEFNPLQATLESLVSDGTITSDQQEAIASALAPAAKNTMAPPPPPPQGVSTEDDDDDYLSEVLQNLVSEGILSSDEQSAIESALSSSSINSSEESNPLQATLESLVSDGTITSDQEEAIASALAPAAKNTMAPPPPPPRGDASEGSNPLQATLESLVSDGTLTSDQASAIAQALAKQNTENTTESV